MEFSQLKRIVAAALQGATFQLPVSRLENPDLKQVSDDFLHAGSLELDRAQPLIEVEGPALEITGQGIAPPFTGMALTFRFWVQAGKAQFQVEAKAPADWELAGSFPAFAGAVTDQLKFDPQRLNRLVLPSAPGSKLGWDTHVDLLAMSGGLSEWLGLKTMPLKGQWQLRKAGLEVEDVSLEAALSTQVNLGFAQVRAMVVRVGSTRVFNAWGNEWSVSPWIALECDIELKARARTYPLRLKATTFNFFQQYRFSADVNQVIQLGLDQLGQLGFTQPIRDFLPSNFRLEDHVTIKDFFADLDIQSPRLLQSVGIDIASTRTWELFKLPGRETPLSIQALTVAFRIYQPLGPEISTWLGITGYLALGDEVRLFLQAAVPDFSLYGKLNLPTLGDDADTPAKLSLRTLVNELLGGEPLPLPLPLLDMQIADLEFEVDLPKQAFELSARMETPDEMEVFGLPLFAELDMEVAYGSVQEAMFKGRLSGTIGWGRLVFGFDLKLGQHTSFAATAENVSLSHLLRIVAQTSLPDGIPDLTAPKVGFEIAAGGAVRLFGHFKVEGQRVELGGKPVDLLSLEIDCSTNKSRTKVDIKFSGKPKLSWIPNIQLNAYALQFTYDKKGEAPADWSLAGDVSLAFFETKEIRLAAKYEKTTGKQLLALEAQTVTQQPPLPENRFTKIAGIDLAASAELRLHLQAAGFLDAQFLVTKEFTPWEEEFKFPLPSKFERFRERIIDLLADTEAFFKLKLDGTPILSLDPKRIFLQWEKTQKGASWTFEAIQDLVFHSPLGGSPALTVRYGKAKFTYQATDKDFAISLTTRDGKLKLVDLPYQVVEEVNEHGQGRLVDKRFEAFLNFRELELRKNAQWEFVAKAQLAFRDLPAPLTAVLDDKIDFAVGYEAKKLYFQSTGGLKRLVLPDLLAKIREMFPDMKLPAIGRSAIKITQLRLEIGKEMTLSVKLGVGLPEQLNEALGLKPGAIFKTWKEDDDTSLVNLRFSVGSKGLDGRLDDSPFAPVAGITPEGDYIHIDFDKLFQGKDLGALKLKKPTLGLDLNKGSFTAAGGYEIDPKRGLKLPLAPLKKLLEILDLKAIADKLPSGFPIDNISLKPADLKKAIESAGIKVPDEFAKVLQEMQGHLDKLPKRFTDYLEISIPKSLDFGLHITGDGGVSFHLSTEAKHPIQLLVPTPLGFQGLRLSHVGFGTVLGGALLKVELSAEFDMFDYLTLAASYFLFDDPNLIPHLPARNSLQRTVTIEKLLMFVIYQTAVPIPVPLFYDRLELRNVGPEGIEVHTRLGFPQPEVNVMAALKILKDLKEVLTQRGRYLEVKRPLDLRLAPELHQTLYEGEMNLVLTAGPFYLRLPKYLGKGSGNAQQITIGPTGSYPLIDALNLAGVALNSAKHLIVEGSPAYLIQSFKYEHRVGAVHLNLFGKLDLKMAWLFCTPQEFAAGAHERLLQGLDAKEVLAILDALPTGRGIPGGQPPAKRAKRIQPLQTPDDKGMIAFLGGKITLGDDFELMAAGGLAISGKGFGTGLRFRARIGKDMLEVGLSGLFTMRKNHLKIAGMGYLQLLGTDILRGEYSLEGDQLYLLGAVDLGQIQIKGALRGTLNSEKLHLQQQVQLRFWTLRFQGEAELLGSKERSLLRLEAKWEIARIASLTVKLYSERTTHLMEAGFLIAGKVVDLVDVHLAGHVENRQGFAVQGEGKLKLLGHELLKGEFRLNARECVFSGSFSLFPKNDIIAVGGSLSGSFTNEAFYFKSTGKFMLKGIAEIEAVTEVVAKQGTGQFTLTLTQFLGTNFGLSLSKKGERLEATTASSGPINLLWGAVQVLGAGTPGPQLSFTTHGGQLEKLSIAGGVRLLGVSTTQGQLNYVNKALNVKLTHVVGDHPIFKGNYTFDGFYSAHGLYAKTSLKAEIDFGKALQAALKSLTGNLVDIGDVSLGIVFDLRNLTVRIDQDLPQDRRSPEEIERLRRERRAIEQEIENLRKLVRENLEEGDKQKVKIQKAIAAHQRELDRNPDTGRANTLRRSIQKLTQMDAGITQLMASITAQKDEVKKQSDIVDALQIRYNHNHAVAADFHDLNTRLWTNSFEAKAAHDRGDGQQYHARKNEFDAIVSQRLRPWVQKYHHQPGDQAEWHKYCVWWAHHSFLGSNRDYYRSEADKSGSSLYHPWYNRSVELQRLLAIERPKYEAAKGELQRRISAIHEAIRESNAYLISDQLTDKTENYFLQYELDTRADFNIPGLDNLADMDAQGYRLIFEVELAFQLPGLAQPIVLPKLAWAMNSPSSVDYNRSVLEMLPHFVFHYFSRELVGILGHSFRSAMDLIKYLVSLVKGKMEINALSDWTTEETSIKFVQGIGNMDRETAQLVWRVSQ